MLWWEKTVNSKCPKNPQVATSSVTRLKDLYMSPVIKKKEKHIKDTFLASCPLDQQWSTTDIQQRLNFFSFEYLSVLFIKNNLWSCSEDTTIKQRKQGQRVDEWLPNCVPLLQPSWDNERLCLCEQDKHYFWHIVAASSLFMAWLLCRGS